MFRIKMKDLALVAFAGGLLAFELAGLHAAAPAMLRTLSGVSGLGAVQAASHGAQVATESMLNGFTATAAQAAVLGVKGAVEGAARQAAAPVTVRRVIAPANECQSYSYVLVVGGKGGATKLTHARLVALRTEACRAKVRAIRAQQRADAARRAIEITSEASAL